MHPWYIATLIVIILGISLAKRIHPIVHSRNRNNYVTKLPLKSQQRKSENFIILPVYILKHNVSKKSSFQNRKSTDTYKDQFSRSRQRMVQSFQKIPIAIKNISQEKQSNTGLLLEARLTSEPNSNPDTFMEDCLPQPSSCLPTPGYLGQQSQWPLRRYPPPPLSVATLLQPIYPLGRFSVGTGRTRDKREGLIPQDIMLAGHHPNLPRPTFDPGGKVRWMHPCLTTTEEKGKRLPIKCIREGQAVWGDVLRLDFFILHSAMLFANLRKLLMRLDCIYATVLGLDVYIILVGLLS